MSAPPDLNRRRSRTDGSLLFGRLEPMRQCAPSASSSKTPASKTPARRRAACLLLAAVAAGAVLAPDRGVTQDFFGFFFGQRERSFRHDRNRNEYQERYQPDRYRSGRDHEPYAYADPSEVPPEYRSRGPARTIEPAPRATYCVRLCDGRFFPMSGPAAASQASAANTCSALCPASKTAVYRGGEIDEAVARNGDRYADLANAFVYRTKLVDGCTCNGKNPLGLARLDIATDPTLKAGDVVATAGGLKVFKGGKGETHKSADFTPIEDSRKVSADLRRHLATTRVTTAP